MTQTRRTCLAELAAAATAACGAGLARAAPAAATFVLIHGAWFGGWCWSGVAAELRGRGHRVFTPSLTGLGDRAHLASANVTLSTHVSDIIDVFESEELSDVVLVAHSYAGVPGAMAVEQIKHRLRRFVLLDAVLPQDGKPLSQLSSPAAWQARVTAAQATPANAFPPPPISAFGLTDAGQVAWLERRLRPQPLGSYSEPPHLTKLPGDGVDTVYVSCERPAMAAIDLSRAQARGRSDWRVVPLAASHGCMISDSALTAATLASLAN